MPRRNKNITSLKDVKLVAKKQLINNSQSQNIITRDKKELLINETKEKPIKKEGKEGAMNTERMKFGDYIQKGFNEHGAIVYSTKYLEEKAKLFKVSTQPVITQIRTEIQDHELIELMIKNSLIGAYKESQKDKKKLEELSKVLFKYAKSNIILNNMVKTPKKIFNRLLKLHISITEPTILFKGKTLNNIFELGMSSDIKECTESDIINVITDALCNDMTIYSEPRKVRERISKELRTKLSETYFNELKKTAELMLSCNLRPKLESNPLFDDFFCWLKIQSMSISDAILPNLQKYLDDKPFTLNLFKNNILTIIDIRLLEELRNNYFLINKYRNSEKELEIFLELRMSGVSRATLVLDKLNPNFRACKTLWENCYDPKSKNNATVVAYLLNKIPHSVRFKDEKVNQQMLEETKNFNKDSLSKKIDTDLEYLEKIKVKPTSTNFSKENKSIKTATTQTNIDLDQYKRKIELDIIVSIMSNRYNMIISPDTKNLIEVSLINGMSPLALINKIIDESLTFIFDPSLTEMTKICDAIEFDNINSLDKYRKNAINVSYHVFTRFNERFPEECEGLNNDDIYDLIRTKVVDGTLLTDKLGNRYVKNGEALFPVTIDRIRNIPTVKTVLYDSGNIQCQADKHLFNDVK